MAERRMFAKTIIDSDAFLDMPLSSQSLYFHLSMRADDDGFINNPKKIQRMIGASDDDAKLLRSKKFILSFETGVIVIKHWKIHNYIQKDRYKPTIYQDEMSELELKDNNGYTLDTERIQDVDTGKVRLGKDRLELGKDIEEPKQKRKRFAPPSIEECIQYSNNKEESEKFILYYESNGWMVGRNKMKNWKSALTGWIKRSGSFVGSNQKKDRNAFTKTNYAEEELASGFGENNI